MCVSGQLALVRQIRVVGVRMGSHALRGWWGKVVVWRDDGLLGLRTTSRRLFDVTGQSAPD